MMINLRSGETGSIHVFFIIIMVLLTWFGLLVQSAIAEEKSDKDKNREILLGPPVSPDKKIIAWFVGRNSSDRNSTEIDYLKEYSGFLTERFAIDGFIIPVYPDWAKEIKLNFSDSAPHSLWWGGIEFKREDFEEVIRDLKSIKWGHFSHNFMYIRTTAEYGNLDVKFDRPIFPAPDWFNDEDGARVRNNAVVAAYIAKEGGFKGIHIDTEDYSGLVKNFKHLGVWRVPFAYRECYTSRFCKEEGVAPRGFKECADQVRKRGREFIEALTSVYPDITVMLRSAGWRYETSLTGPFIEGLLEGKGEATVVVTTDSYNRTQYKEFLRDREEEFRKGIRLVKRPELLERDLEWGHSFWMDPAPGDKYHSWNIEKNLEYNYLNPEQLEHTLYNVLTSSDRYVWMYLARAGRFWFSEGPPWPGMRRSIEFSPTPQAYLDAFKNCRKPHDLNWEPYEDKNKYKSAKEELCYDDESTFGDLWKHFDLIVDLPKRWKFASPPAASGDSLRQSSVGDFSYQDSIQIGEFWENQDCTYDGVGWYRVRFNVPEKTNGEPLKGKKILLCFGGIAGNAYVYFNDNDPTKEARPIYTHGEGDRLQKSYDERFFVDVTDRIILGGENALTVRVENYKGPGGIWKSVKLIALKPHDKDWLRSKEDTAKYKLAKEESGYDDETTFGDLWSASFEELDFPKTWLFKFDPENNQEEVNTDISNNEGWKPIQIGEFWENQGYPYDGVGWYRVRFTFPYFHGRIPRLCFGGVAGGVEIYLNGGKNPIPYHLYDYEQREYNRRFEVEIPTGLMRRGQENILIVRVSNYKGPGGIWKSVKLIAGY